MILSPAPKLAFLDNNGRPLVGGQLFTYEAGTNTKVATYSNEGGTLNTNPVILDFRGECNMWLDPALSYKFVLAGRSDTDPPTNPIWSVDDISGWTQSSIGQIIWPKTQAETDAGVTIDNYGYPPLNPFRYGADGAGSSVDETALARVRLVIAQLDNMAEWRNWYMPAAWPQSEAEAQASSTGIIPNFRAPGDSDGVLSVFRFMTQAQIESVQRGDSTLDVSAAIQAANDYLEGRAANCILTLTLSSGGSGYTDGTYLTVPMTGGTGTNAKCQITVSGGGITSVVPSGPVTHTVNAAGFGNYTVGDSLTPATDNDPTSPLYFPSGGSGAVITVATVSTAGGKTASGLPQGGKLFFPPGLYFCNTSALRVGSFVEWVGNSQDSVLFAWASSYSGVGIYLGPDESGFYGFIGYYTMGSVLDSMTLNTSTDMTWMVYGDGVQQGSYIRRLNLHNVTNGGIYIKDNKGGVYFKMSDFEITGASVMPTNAGQPTGIGIQLEYGGCVEVNQVTVIGGGSASAANGIFLTGISMVAGNALISDFQAEECLTGIDFAAGFLAYGVIVDRTLFSNTSFGSPKGIWVRSTAAPILNVRALTAGAGIVGIQNDKDGYVAPSGSSFAIPSYIYNSDPAYISKHQNVIVTGVRNNPVGTTGTFTPDINLGDWQLINVTASPITIAAPVYSGNAMPASLNGQELTLTVFNNGAGVGPTVNFNAVFHLAGSLTSTNTGENTSAKFRWTGTAWYQITPWTAVVTN